MRFAPEVTLAARLRRLHCMPALCWHPRACGRACAPCARRRTSAAGSRSPLRTVLRQDENRLVDREQALRIRPPSASPAPVNCRRCRQPARRPPAPPPEPGADPAATAMSTGTRAVGAPSASFGAAAGAGSNCQYTIKCGQRHAPTRSPRVRRRRTRAAAPSPWRRPRGGTPSVGRRMPPWRRRGPRSTGASAPARPARFPGAAWAP